MAVGWMSNGTGSRESRFSEVVLELEERQKDDHCKRHPENGDAEFDYEIGVAHTGHDGCEKDIQGPQCENGNCYPDHNPEESGNERFKGHGPIPAIGRSQQLKPESETARSGAEEATTGPYMGQA